MHDRSLIPSPLQRLTDHPVGRTAHPACLMRLLDAPRTTMRRGLGALLSLTLGISPTGHASAQPRSDARAVAITAIRDMLSAIPGPRRVLTVDPRVMKAETAPGVATGQDHAPLLIEALTSAGMVTASRATIATCPKCPAVQVGVLVAISAPVIGVDSATVTITAYHTTPSSRRTEYETVHYTLLRRGQRWEIVRRIQIGVS